MANNIRRRFKLLLAQRDLSKRELARRAGAAYSYLTDVTCGRRKPSAALAKKIAELLGEPPESLFGEWWGEQ